MSECTGRLIHFREGMQNLADHWLEMLWMHTGAHSVSVLVVVRQRRYTGFCTVRVYICPPEGTELFTGLSR